MRWTVEGADARTGKERSLTVEAASGAEAESQARYNGLHVSGSYPAGSKRSAGEPRPNGPPVPVPPVPEYRDVTNNAKTARLLASIASGVGFVFGFGSLALVAGAIQAGSKSVAAGLVGAALLTWGLSAMITALGFFITAVGLRLLASVALAHRDLVRHSLSR